MAQTKIGWTHRRHPTTKKIHPGYTFNPWIGCTKVPDSPACDRCYAWSLDEARFSKTLGGATPQNPISHWGPGAPRHRTAEDTWKNPLKWNKQAQEAGIALAVFCASMADVFDKEVSDGWRDDLFDLIYQTPHLDWLLLTKRTDKMRDYLTSSAWWINATPQNVWLGATTEDQNNFDRRIDDLLATPAKRHFLSVEPMLGRIDIGRGLKPADGFEQMCDCCGGAEHSNRIDWVIAGGESNGPAKAKQLESRSTHPDHVLDLATQCWMTNTPFFWKQWGDYAPAYELDPQAAAMCAMGHVERRDLGHGEGGRRYQFCVGKTMAGNLLDGVRSEEMPEIRLVA